MNNQLVTRKASFLGPKKTIYIGFVSVVLTLFPIQARADSDPMALCDEALRTCEEYTSACDEELVQRKLSLEACNGLLAEKSEPLFTTLELILIGAVTGGALVFTLK